ncbi:F-box only protein 6-like [Euwallacea fornicatus]|uniref:F-box only protein 6-like n=1 Tax=Euwallacea fornicatus TaxID=995702 RepID=UPI00338E6D7B
MASIIKKIASSFSYGTVPDEKNIQFLGQFDIQGDTLNGLVLNGSYIPQEILITIFTYLTPSDILQCSLVCKNWHNIGKSNALWHDIYNNKEYPKKAKKLPWYVFYCFYATDNFKNLIKNGNGQEGFDHWYIAANEGDKFIVENVPCGSCPLPEEPEFFGYTSCFASSYGKCAKYQEIDLKPKRLLRYIIVKYKPTLFASEWFAGRFDCASSYQLTISCTVAGNDWKPHDFRYRVQGTIVNRRSPDYFVETSGLIEQWANKPWQKKELYLSDYPLDIMRIHFCHEGQDRQFWKGHYGSKMAGGVLKFLLDSIEPISENIH